MTVMKSVKKRLLSGSAWAFLGMILTAVLSFAVNWLLTKVLEPKDVGTYFLAFNIINLASVLGSLGLNRAVVRLVAANLALKLPGRAYQTIQLMLKLTLLGAMGIAVSYYFGGHTLALSFFRDPKLAGVTAVLAGWMFFKVFELLIAETFRSFHNILAASTFSGVLSALLLTAGLTFFKVSGARSGVVTIILLSAAATFLSTLIGGWLLQRKVDSLPRQDGKAAELTMLEIWQTSWPIWVTSVTHLIITQGDQWLLGIFTNQKEVAIYGIVARLLFLVSTPLVIINAVVPPLMAEMYAQGKKNELESTLRGLATLGGLPAILVLSLFIFRAEPLLGMVYGNFYRAGAPILIILSVGQLINVWSGSCGFLLLMTGNEVSRMKIAVFSVAILLGGGWFAVKFFGTIGLAVVAAFTLSFQNVLMVLAAKRHTGIWTQATFSLNTIRQVFVRN